jgi:YVTN family beta-propeller protein
VVSAVLTAGVAIGVAPLASAKALPTFPFQAGSVSCNITASAKLASALKDDWVQAQHASDPVAAVAAIPDTDFAPNGPVATTIKGTGTCTGSVREDGDTGPANPVPAIDFTITRDPASPGNPTGQTCSSLTAGSASTGVEYDTTITYPRTKAEKTEDYGVAPTTITGQTLSPSSFTLSGGTLSGSLAGGTQSTLGQLDSTAAAAINQTPPTSADPTPANRECQPTLKVKTTNRGTTATLTAPKGLKSFSFVSGSTLTLNAADQPVAPGPPPITSVVGGNAQATVSFGVPDDGGSPIISYLVKATDSTTPANGGQTATSTSSPIVVTGLTNGDTYTFTVTAENDVGSTTSSPSPPVVPATVPGAPTITGVTPGDGQVTVDFTPPTSNGGSPVVSYRATATDSTTPANGGQTASGTSSPIVVTGLTPEDSYTFTVTATNSAGAGSASAPSASVFPDVTGVTVGTTTVGNRPLAVSSDGTHVWVANYDSNTVSELNASDGSLVQTIPVGSAPRGISSDGDDVWVADEASDAVTELDASDGSLVRTIPVGDSPTAVSSYDGLVWVANEGDGTVTEIEASTGQVIRTPEIGNQSYGISSDGVNVWVADTDNFNPGDKTVTMYNINSRRSQILPVGTEPDAVSSDGTHAWVANWSDNTLTELNAANGNFVATIHVGTNPSGVVSDGTHVWVANWSDNTVTELNASDGSLVRTIPVGAIPSAISSDGAHVWVANSSSNSVTELNAGA